MTRDEKAIEAIEVEEQEAREMAARVDYERKCELKAAAVRESWRAIRLEREARAAEGGLA